MLEIQTGCGTDSPEELKDFAVDQTTPHTLRFHFPRHDIERRMLQSAIPAFAARLSYPRGSGPALVPKSGEPPSET